MNKEERAAREKRVAEGREREAAFQAKLEATKGRRSLRKETLGPKSKLVARYGVYLDSERIGAVGYTRGGHWWPIFNGKLASGITFGSRDTQAAVVVEWFLRGNQEV